MSCVQGDRFPNFFVLWYKVLLFDLELQVRLLEIDYCEFNNFCQILGMSLNEETVILLKLWLCDKSPTHHQVNPNDILISIVHKQSWDLRFLFKQIYDHKDIFQNSF